MNIDGKAEKQYTKNYETTSEGEGKTLPSEEYAKKRGARYGSWRRVV